MAEQSYAVDVIYREIPLLRQASLQRAEEHEGFVETDEPLPVGTTLQLLPAEGGPPVVVRVAEIRERRKKMRTGEVPGMRVTIREESVAAWRALVAGEIPAADGALSEEPTRLDLPSSIAEETIVDQAPAAALAAAATEASADPSAETGDDAPGADETAADIEDAVSAPDADPAAARDAGEAAAEPTTEDDAGGRRRRKKGGKRRRKR